MKIGFYKPFIKIYFHDDTNDLNATSYEVVNVMKIFAERGHQCYILSESDLEEGTIKNIHKAGIRIAGFFMYGLDSDTIDTSSLLSKFIIKNRIALPMLNILVPTPGTRLYDKLKREGRILSTIMDIMN